jgi:hypothetical protein
MHPGSFQMDYVLFDRVSELHNSDCFPLLLSMGLGFVQLFGSVQFQTQAKPDTGYHGGCITQTGNRTGEF